MCTDGWKLTRESSFRRYRNTHPSATQLSTGSRLVLLTASCAQPFLGYGKRPLAIIAAAAADSDDSIDGKVRVGRSVCRCSVLGV